MMLMFRFMGGLFVNLSPFPFLANFSSSKLSKKTVILFSIPWLMFPLISTRLLTMTTSSSIDSLFLMYWFALAAIAVFILWIIVYISTNRFNANTIILTIYISINETTHPIKYNWTENTCSTLFSDLPDAVKFNTSRKKKAKTRDNTKLSTNQNNSLKKIALIRFGFYGFLMTLFHFNLVER